MTSDNPAIKMELREIKDLTETDVMTHCMFEIIIFVSDHDSEDGKEVERKIFCKAWRKPIQPLTLLDNSAYPKKDTRGGEWTIQWDTYEWRTPGWDTYVKENRSDNVVLRDLNTIIGIRKNYENIRIFFFSQGYPDWEYDHYCSFIREERGVIPSDVYRRRWEYQQNFAKELY